MGNLVQFISLKQNIINNYMFLKLLIRIKLMNKHLKSILYYYFYVPTIREASIRNCQFPFHYFIHENF